MNILGKTGEYIAEYDRAPGHGYMLTIARASDGQAVALYGRDIVGGFREAMAKYGIERTIASYIRAARNDWRPCYKPGAVARMISNP